MASRPYTGRTTSPYGPRVAPTAGASTWHEGIDGIGGYNTAPESGTVIGYGYVGGWGNRITFRGDSGTVHYLAHNAPNGLLVSVGVHVREGATLGVKGMTGVATGVHVHWETRPGGGSTIDPERWLREQNTTRPATVVKFSQTVKNEQSWLNRSRGERLVTDGLLGPATKAAIKRYQAFLGVKTDGVWGPATQAAHAVYYARVTKPKAKPKAKPTTASFGRVDVVQRALKTKYRLYASKLAVDNIDGPATKAAVKEFQRRAGLKVDGVAGPVTRKALGV